MSKNIAKVNKKNKKSLKKNKNHAKLENQKRGIFHSCNNKTQILYTQYTITNAIVPYLTNSHTQAYNKALGKYSLNNPAVKIIAGIGKGNAAKTNNTL